MRPKRIAAAAALILCSNFTMAGVSNYLFRTTLFPTKGFYAGGGIGGGETYAKNLSGQILPNGSAIGFHVRGVPFLPVNSTTGFLNGGTVDSVRQSLGISWVLSAGYQFNPNFAVQFDYFNFRASHMNLNENFTFNPPTTPTVTGTARISKYAFDIVMRGMFEVKQTGIHLYGKTGLGVLRQNIYNLFYMPSALTNIGGINFKTDATSITVGAGAIYYIGNNLNLDVNWAHFFGRGSGYAFHKLPGADYVGLSLLYTLRLTNLQS